MATLGTSICWEAGPCSCTDSASPRRTSISWSTTRRLEARSASISPAEASVQVYEHPTLPRIDLSTGRVHGLIALSPTMAARSLPLLESFSQLRVLSIVDLLLLKLVPDRPKDDVHIEALLAAGIDWTVLVAEVAWQAGHSESRAVTPVIAQALAARDERGHHIPCLADVRRIAEAELERHVR